MDPVDGRRCSGLLGSWSPKGRCDFEGILAAGGPYCPGSERSGHGCRFDCAAEVAVCRLRRSDLCHRGWYFHPIRRTGRGYEALSA